MARRSTLRTVLALILALAPGLAAAHPGGPHVHGLLDGFAHRISGLDHLAGKGLRMGMLYVDAGNTPAVTLYRDMGFTVDHIDRAYTADVDPVNWDPLIMKFCEFFGNGTQIFPSRLAKAWQRPHPVPTA